MKTTLIAIALVLLTATSFAAVQSSTGQKIGKEEASILHYSLLVGGNSGESIASGRSHRSAQVSAVSGSATILIQGSNDNSNWATLTTNGSVPVSFTAAGVLAVFETTAYIRPLSSGTASTAATVDLLLSK